jgi:hypothetical protein
LSLSTNDECVRLIEAAAAPIPPGRRPAFYERVSKLLRDEDVLVPTAVRAACVRAHPERAADRRRAAAAIAAPP